MRNSLYASTAGSVGHIPASIITEFLSNDDVAGRGPAYHKFGRIVRYSRAVVLEWAAQQMRTSTAEAA
jgi:hypothetical protein